MKKVLVIANGPTTLHSLYNQVQDAIGEMVQVNSSLVSELESYEDHDLLVFSSPDSYKFASAKLKIEKPFLIAERVVNHKKLIEIVAQQAGSKVLLVNDSYETAYEAISQLKVLGIDQLDYTAYYPGVKIDDFSQFDIALTLGEPHLVPAYFNDFIDLGTRIIAIKSIHEIVERLELKGRFNQKLTERYIKDIVDIMKAIEVSRRNLKKSENLLTSIINTVEQGIVCIDEHHNINRSNSNFERIIGRHSKDILNKKLDDVVGELDPHELMVEPKIIDISGRKYLCATSQVEGEDNHRHVITFENINRLRNKDIKLKEFYRGQKHVPLHTFEDYVTLNEANLMMIEKAKRFAVTESNILILGENGTGKEILAQAIHRYSKRREKPFLPVNITAISDSLLESELFGYEPGAFTGADKNGKVGIFEKAEGGTVFIDEIGDAPLTIQARLLRVIQEKRIRRVGGHEEIPVDVRIVSATNKNLHQMVRNEAFREDLYFRLNVLPLQTMPLRDRNEDILHLLKLFMKAFLDSNDLQLEHVLSEEVLEVLQKYSWRGNVRELLNFAEFIQAIYMDNLIGKSDLPDYLLNEMNTEKGVTLDYMEYKTLGKLSTDRFFGRRTVAEELNHEGIETTEGQVRGVLKKLEAKGLIETLDRKGARLTLRGHDIFKSYMNNKIWS